MRPVFRVCLAGGTVASLLIGDSGAQVWAQAADRPAVQAIQTTPLLTSNRTLQEGLDRLFAGSAAWRTAVEALRRTGRRAYIVTPNQVRVTDIAGGAAKPFDERVLAEAEPIPDRDLRVDVVVVIVNLALLEKSHGSRRSMLDFEADLDRILAHEVYGHAVPYLLAGHLSGKCADPRPGQPAGDSCAIQRENEIRLQAGLGLRMDYGLDGLAVARRGLQ